MDAYEKEFELRWSDADANGHIRHTVYAELGAEVRMGFLRAGGFDWQRFKAVGLGPVLLREELEYRREVGLGERVRIRLEAVASSKDGARWKLRHDVLKENGELAARVTVTGGWIDLAARKLAVPPPELASLLTSGPRAAEFEELPDLRR